MVIDVAILGASGLVGQKAVALLSRFPEFRIVELIASDRHVGQSLRYEWRDALPYPDQVASVKLSALRDLRAGIVLSCLPADVAREIEPFLAEQGKIVFSNASSFRMRPDVPLVIPEVNAHHLALSERQNTPGKIITNPNCSVAGIMAAIAPLTEISEISHISVVTLQSVSGAGYSGLKAMEIASNTIPHINGEAEKIVAESGKILGDNPNFAQCKMTVHTHRVPVVYGHTITLHIAFTEPVTPERVSACYEVWNNKYPGLFVLHDTRGRPQPVLDLSHDDMRVHIGHLKQGGAPNFIGLVSLTHNLVRGAAGAAIANMRSYFNYVDKARVCA